MAQPRIGKVRSIKVSDSDWDDWKKDAQRERRSASDWVRDACREKLNRRLRRKGKR